mgnify:CR=1 FL=1
MNGKLANDLRRAILNKIMIKSGILEQGEGSGELLRNTPMFSKALTEIEGGVGDFAQFRSLFPKKYVFLVPKIQKFKVLKKIMLSE